MPSTVQSIIELVVLIIIFVIVLVVCYYTTRFVAGRQMVQKRLGNFEIIETFPIAQNKYLQLIRMGDKYVVISVSKDTVSYVTELKEEEICRIQNNTSTIAGKSFKEVLSGFSKEKNIKQDK